MNKQIEVRKPMNYEPERDGFYVIEDIRGCRILNVREKQMIDSIMNGSDLDQLLECAREESNQKAKKKEVYLLLKDLKESEYINYDESYFDEIININRVCVAGEQEYQIISECIIHSIKNNTYIYCDVKRPIFHNKLNLRGRDFYNAENHFYEMKDGKITNLLGVTNMKTVNRPAVLSFIYSEYSVDEAIEFYYKCEQYIKELGKSKVKLVLNESPNKLEEEFIKKANFEYEATLEKEHEEKDFIVYSRFL